MAIDRRLFILVSTLGLSAVLIAPIAVGASATVDDKQAMVDSARRGLIDLRPTEGRGANPSRDLTAAEFREAVLRTGVAPNRADAPAKAPDTIPEITSPTSGAAIGGSASVQVTSAAPFVRIELGPLSTTVAGTGVSAQANFDTFGLTGAQNILAADCSDAAGLDCGTQAAPVSVTVGNTAPSLTSPAQGDVVGLDVAAAATSQAHAVAFLIDGLEFYFDDAVPFAGTILTDGLAVGMHEMTVVNCDADHRCAVSNPSNSRTFEVRDRLFPEVRQAQPNPFNPSGPSRVSKTTVTYSLDVDSHVAITIRRSNGQLVRGPVEYSGRSSGTYSYAWSGQANNGSRVATGSTSSNSTPPHSTGPSVVTTPPP